MTATSLTSVAVSRRINAPADAIFAVLADPAMHPTIDGSGMVRRAVSAAVIGSVGEAFRMSMHNDEMGSYEMTNHVVTYEPNRRIGWEPVMTKASRPEHQEGVGVPGHQVWAFELTPIDADTTEVTETYDCARSPEWLRTVIRNGERWRESMTATLQKLEQAARSYR